MVSISTTTKFDAPGARTDHNAAAPPPQRIKTYHSPNAASYDCHLSLSAKPPASSDYPDEAAPVAGTRLMEPAGSP